MVPLMPVAHCAILHLDESCLGNGREGATPGGAGGLIEIQQGGAIVRRDFYLHAPDTTNNRMALGGAIAALHLLAAKKQRLRVVMISDSEYLVRGMREWVPGWIRRGWRRKGGVIENLELWQVLVAATKLHTVTFAWVRGHAGHTKNEYANDLAVLAAREQRTSDGVVESGFLTWLAIEREKGRYLDYDPDRSFQQLVTRVGAGDPMPLVLNDQSS